MDAMRGSLTPHLMKYLNVIGPQVRRLRVKKGWSQEFFAIKLQIIGMEHATQKKVYRIESREVWVSDDDILFMARVLKVQLEELYPPSILCAGRLYEAICKAKASRFGCLVMALLFYPELGV